MKKLLKALIVALVLSLVVGCSTKEPTVEPEAKDDTLKIGYTVQTLDNEYFVTIANGVKSYGESLGYEVEIANGNQDIATQVAQIEDFIQKEMDIILVSPVSDTGYEDAVKQAHDAGIVVIACNQDFSDADSDAFVTIPEYALGRSLGDAAGKYIAETWGNEGEGVDVLVLDLPDIEAIIPRGDGLREGVLEYAPKANIVQSISANTNDKGLNAMQIADQKFPNIQVVIAVNDAAALGAYSYIDAQKLAEGNDKYYVGGMDGTKQALELIKAGTAYKATIDINAPGTGKVFIDTALKVIENGPIAETVEIPLNVVTAANVDEYLAAYGE